jgi:hypothetical protein
MPLSSLHFSKVEFHHRLVFLESTVSESCCLLAWYVPFTSSWNAKAAPIVAPRHLFNFNSCCQRKVTRREGVVRLPAIWVCMVFGCFSQTTTYHLASGSLLLLHWGLEDSKLDSLSFLVATTVTTMMQATLHARHSNFAVGAAIAFFLWVVK